MTTNSLANTSIQATAPPHLRGRVMGLFVMAFLGIMPISGLVFGSLGQFIGPASAVLVGSIALIAWALLLVARPNWLRQRGDEPGPPTGMGLRS
jgi:MFS family permease